MPTTNETNRSGRATGLDGLRGIAAMTVALGHFFLLFPANCWTPVWKYSPLYVLIARREAVVVFFVLSGFALHRMRRSSYWRFTARRTIRIYGPYLGALAFAVAGNQWLSQGNRPRFSDWFNQAWPIPVHSGDIKAHLLFLGNYDTTIFNGAFWSLVQEMRISLMFPLLDWVVARLRVTLSICIAAEMIVSGSLLRNDTIHYAGLFVAGIIVARNPSLKLNRFWFVGATILFYYGRGISRLFPPVYADLLDLPVGLGASVIVVWAMQSSWLLSRTAQWFGERSFSLYLIHMTVLLGLVNILGLQKPVLSLVLLYVPLTLLITDLFYRAIERPLLKLSRRVDHGRIQQEWRNCH